MAFCCLTHMDVWTKNFCCKLSNCKFSPEVLKASIFLYMKIRNPSSMLVLSRLFLTSKIMISYLLVMDHGWKSIWFQCRIPIRQLLDLTEFWQYLDSNWTDFVPDQSLDRNWTWFWWTLDRHWILCQSVSKPPIPSICLGYDSCLVPCLSPDRLAAH